MEKERVFAKGFFYDNPNEGAPQFLIGRISVKVADAVEFLKQHEKVNGYVNLDIKLPREGNRPFIELNQWQPEKPKSLEEQPVEKIEYPQEDINPDDIPFN